MKDEDNSILFLFLSLASKEPKLSYSLKHKKVKKKKKEKKRKKKSKYIECRTNQFRNSTKWSLIHPVIYYTSTSCGIKKD